MINNIVNPSFDTYSNHSSFNGYEPEPPKKTVPMSINWQELSAECVSKK